MYVHKKNMNKFYVKAFHIYAIMKYVFTLDLSLPMVPFFYIKYKTCTYMLSIVFFYLRGSFIGAKHNHDMAYRTPKSGVYIIKCFLRYPSF